jgi:hypothetical protein
VSYIQHLTGSTDLITPPEEIRAGFVALALERNRQATPFVEQARALKVLAQQVKYPIDLLKIDGIQTALLTAVGFSDKIVDSMAQEIWRHLEKGTLKNAANLTKADQVASLSNWLVSL